VLISGFILAGSTPKSVVVRALGPSLSQVGVPNTLQNPRLELFSTDDLIATNDNWQDAEQAAIVATDLQPADAREAALRITLQPGAYTVIESGGQNDQGVGLVEVYDADRSSTAVLMNISTRGVVKAGDDVMIGGVIIGGTSSGEFVVRALGPSLAQQVNDPLPDPVLELYDSNGNIIASNDNWPDDPERAQLQARGFAPGSNFEPALLRTLAPGSYTAIVRSSNPNITGVALVEFYRL
jgi:hypothetical protein